MPAAIPRPVREVILKRWQKGESLASLAEELKLSVRTVRNLVSRFAERGESGLEPDYGRCATNTLPTDSDEFQKAVDMRKQHQIPHRPHRQLELFGKAGYGFAFLPTLQNHLTNRQRNSSWHRSSSMKRVKSKATLL